ncbi:hypothetical protein KAR91_36165 [Candidatus Pacearchaeota archaeon]|nr:hypothetical protein [Candidatus Pacearchaeota archaeon]
MDFSMEQVAVDLNGHTVTGWSDDTDGLSLPDVDLATVIRGADGKMVAINTGNKGGPVIFKLLANSSSTKFFMNAVAAQLNGSSIEFNCTVRDSINQTTISMVKGTLSNAPLGQTLGKGSAGNRNFTIEFERITPDYQAAKF